MTTFCLSIIFIFFCNSCLKTNALQCMDDNNEPVDWFAAYKFPKLKHENKLIKTGAGFVYLSSKNYTGWSLSRNSINDSNSMIGHTLLPFYAGKNVSFVFYNDQPPNEPSKASKGHTKGVILTDSESGFWLIHSVPHFPPLSSKYKFSDSGIIKGQSFLCVSLDLKNLNKVGIQLQYNEPQIFASNVSEILHTKLDQIIKVVSGIVVTEPPWYNKIDLVSLNGVKFTSFAKANKFGKDLYEDWIAPALQSDLFVETWLNGPGRLPSNCSKPFRVFNVEEISIKTVNVSFHDTQDHSKWAAALNSSWICIGDINRMDHQKSRGGGSLCLNNEKLAANYRSSVLSTEKCNTRF